MDFVSLKAFADTALELHSSDHGSRIEMLVAVYLTVRHFTKPIAAVARELAAGHTINSGKLVEHSKLLDEHTVKIENHEKRIGVLETN